MNRSTSENRRTSFLFDLKSMVKAWHSENRGATYIAVRDGLWVSYVSSNFGFAPLTTAKHLGERKLGIEAANAGDVSRYSKVISAEGRLTLQTLRGHCIPASFHEQQHSPNPLRPKVWCRTVGKTLKCA